MDIMLVQDFIVLEWCKKKSALDRFSMFNVNDSHYNDRHLFFVESTMKSNSEL